MPGQPKAPKSKVEPQTPAVAGDTPIIALGSEKLAEFSVINPAPDASPSREPTGTYRVISFG